MHAVIALIALAVIGFAAAFSILPLQSRRERQDHGKTPEQEWTESAFTQLSRGDFELCRIMPTAKWSVAEFIFEDESRREFGRYTTPTRVRGTISFSDRSATLYIQGSGINRSMFASQVGGTSGRSLVIRDDERLLAEVFRRFESGRLVSDLDASGRKLTMRSLRWAAFTRGSVFEGDRQVAEYRRNPGLSRKILIAFDRTLPQELRVCLCSLTLLR
jgi:hypothetical protein